MIMKSLPTSAIYDKYPSRSLKIIIGTQKIVGDHYRIEAQEVF